MTNICRIISSEQPISPIVIYPDLLGNIVADGKISEEVQSAVELWRQDMLIAGEVERAAPVINLFSRARIE